ncbi:hypothetical protein [Streptomyces cinereoruber]|uniref:hypothetical protein n=1 Tax=Streptomyces cinereoruber TaxID=67260 RepID=UPI00363D0AA6
MNQHDKAATRARLLAGIIRSRAKGHPDAPALRAVARSLGKVARHLLDGSGDDAAERAHTALWQIRRAAPLSLPSDVIAYVSAALDGRNPGLHDLMPANPEHAHREGQLRARLLDLTEAGHLDSAEEAIVAAALAALLDLHTEHAALAEDVADHGRADAQPTAFRPHHSPLTGTHLPGRLTVSLHGRLIAELHVPYGITPDEIWQILRTFQLAA